MDTYQYRSHRCVDLQYKDLRRAVQDIFMKIDGFKRLSSKAIMAEVNGDDMYARSVIGT